MPRRDGTGPCGQGAMTGKGSGLCRAGNQARIAELGCGFQAGLRRGEGCARVVSRENLTQQKAALESKLEQINRQLDR